MAFTYYQETMRPALIRRTVRDMELRSKLYIERHGGNVEGPAP